MAEPCRVLSVTAELPPPTYAQGRLWPRDADERQRAIDANYDLDKILHTADLCAGKRVFFAATGISDGDLVRGVRYFAGGATTNSIVCRSESGTGALLCPDLSQIWSPGERYVLALHR